MIPFEIGNALTRLKRRHILNDEKVIEAYSVYKKIPLKLVEVNIENALKIALIDFGQTHEKHSKKDEFGYTGERK